MQFLEKLRKMRGNFEILNFPEQKKEGIAQYQNQIIILQSFHRTIISNRNEKKNEILMNKPVCLGLSIR